MVITLVISVLFPRGCSFCETFVDLSNFDTFKIARESARLRMVSIHSIFIIVIAIQSFFTSKIAN